MPSYTKLAKWRESQRVGTKSAKCALGIIQEPRMMYYYIYDEIRKEIGEQKAAGIMKRGIYKRGLEFGRQFAVYAPSETNGLKDAFLEFVPDDGKMFQPELLRCGGG